MTKVDSDVTTDDVRTALQEIDADEIPDSTIDAAIEDTEIIVGSRLPDGWEDDDKIEDYHIDLIVKHAAKRRAFNSAGTEVRAAALDATVSLDIQAFRGQLNRDVEEAWSTIGLDVGGDRTAFVDATGHAPPGGTERRKDRHSEYYGW